MNINFKELSSDELKELITTAKIELETRTETKKVIYTHDCYGSSNYHFGKYRHWAKVVTGIDESKKGGYAILGQFLNCQNENLVPKNSLIVETCSGYNFKVYKIGEKSKELLVEGSRKSFQSFLRDVKKYLI